MLNLKFKFPMSNNSRQGPCNIFLQIALKHFYNKYFHQIFINLALTSSIVFSTLTYPPYANRQSFLKSERNQQCMNIIIIILKSERNQQCMNIIISILNSEKSTMYEHHHHHHCTAEYLTSSFHISGLKSRYIFIDA